MKPMADSKADRFRQIVWGAGILLTIAALVCGALLGWRHLPGVFGEWMGFVVGVATTPFFLEATFAVLGLTIILAINYWRRRRAGDELVYLEQVDSGAGLPEHASWAVFRERPLDVEMPTPLARLEGALAISDHDEAAGILSVMTEDELKRPETLALRIQLARATGMDDLARRLEDQLRES